MRPGAIPPYNRPVITKFSVLYVGHIELEDVGRDGTPADERRYPNERLVEAYATVKELAQLLDGLGFHCLWTAEHHFQREGYEVFPNLILLNTWLATQTERLKLGCAFNVLPTWHPIRLAEDFAVADIVTGGRVVFGIGRGYQTREVESLGAPLLDQDCEPRALRGGARAAAQGLRRGLVLPPRQAFPGAGSGRVPGEAADRGDARAEADPQAGARSGRRCRAGARSASWRGRASTAWSRSPARCCSTSGSASTRRRRPPPAEQLELGEGLCWGVAVYLAESDEEAIRRMEPFHDERYKWFEPFGIVRYTDDEGRPWGSPGAPSGSPSLRDGVAQKAWLCGTPQSVIETIREIEARYPGLDQLMIHLPEGMPPGEFMEQLRLFARDVMPAFAARMPTHV